MRNAVDSRVGAKEFDRVVNNYNTRCASYRYKRGSRARAKREVGRQRHQIETAAVLEARGLDGVPDKPGPRYTRAAQEALTVLGYHPGAIDGKYGANTASPVKAFQRDEGVAPDGWVDRGLLSRLKEDMDQRAQLTISH
jgi:murein L,D-transpeptidase YcbB/YkuD